MDNDYRLFDELQNASANTTVDTYWGEGGGNR